MNHVQAELATFSLFSFHSLGLDGENSRDQKKQGHYRRGGWAWLHRTPVCSTEKSVLRRQKNPVARANLLPLRQGKMKRAPEAVEGLLVWATTLSQHTYVSPPIIHMLPTGSLNTEDPAITLKTRKRRNITGQSQRNVCNRHLDR